MMTSNTTTAMILVRSDHGDGGWSLHPAGVTDDAIAEGDALTLADGPAEHVGGGWDRPNAADYIAAETALRKALGERPRLEAYIEELRALIALMQNQALDYKHPNFTGESSGADGLPQPDEDYWAYEAWLAT